MTKIQPKRNVITHDNKIKKREEKSSWYLKCNNKGETDRQIDRQTDRQTDRDRDRQRHRETERETERERPSSRSIRTTARQDYGRLHVYAGLSSRVCLNLRLAGSV